MLARIDTTLFKFSEHDDQASPGKQGSKRLGRVVVQSAQGCGRVTPQHAKHTGHQTRRYTASPATKYSVLPRRPHWLDMSSRNTHDATGTLMLMSRIRYTSVAMSHPTILSMIDGKVWPFFLLWLHAHARPKSLKACGGILSK